MMDRRAVLAGIMAGLAGPALGGVPARSVRPVQRPGVIRPRDPAATVQQIIAQSGLSGQVACALADVESGAILHGTSAQAPLPPASVTKSLTALYALDRLGPQHRFATQVLAAGALNGGRLEGDLVLVGSGDPTLDTDALADLARQVRAAGVLEVTGRLLVWGGALPTIDQIDPSQPQHVGYNPTISGLNLNYNRVYFEWKAVGSDYAISMDARSQTLRPAVDVVRMRLANRKAPLYTYKLVQGHEDWTVARGALGGGGGRWLPVRQPVLYAGDVMLTLLGAQGVRIRGAQPVGAPPSGRIIARHRSDALPEMVRGMLKYSTNLTAEALGLAASRAQGGAPRSLASSAQQMNAWLKAAAIATNPKLRDHSGLGAASDLSVADMVQTLLSRRAQTQLQPLLKTIPPTKAALAAGAPEAMEIRAKTGTLNFVSTLAGYVEAPGQPARAFAIFCADMPLRARLTQAQAERPPGGRAWQRKARDLQMALLGHWGQADG